MRIGIFEINISKRQSSVDNKVWNRSPLLPQRLEFMTPTELRQELAKIAEHLEKGGSIIGAGGQRKQVLFISGGTKCTD